MHSSLQTNTGNRSEGFWKLLTFPLWIKQTCFRFLPEHTRTLQCSASHKETPRRFIKLATCGLQLAWQPITGNFRENKSIAYFLFKMMTEKCDHFKWGIHKLRQHKNSIDMSKMSREECSKSAMKWASRQPLIKGSDRPGGKETEHEKGKNGMSKAGHGQWCRQVWVTQHGCYVDAPRGKVNWQFPHRRTAMLCYVWTSLWRVAWWKVTFKEGWSRKSWQLCK